jgi:ATP-dependent DNA helicase RecG
VDLLSLVEALLESIGDDWDASAVEDHRIDFKETPETAGNDGARARKRFHELLAETAVCFANAEGGAIVVGVRDRAATREEALPGVPPAYTPEELVSVIFERTAPAILTRPSVLETDGRRVIVLLTPRGSGVHSTTQGVYKIRLNDRCVPLAGDQLRGLRALREQYDWTAESSGLNVDALSVAALERASDMLRRSGHDDLADLARIDVAGFCRATRLLADDGVTRAGVLLYGTARALREAVPEWGINVQTRTSPGSEPRILMRRGDADVPLVLLLDEVIRLVGALAAVQTIRVGAEQVELVDYPADAVREILANAFAHRDWEALGVVDVVHSPDELVVTSPGSLLPTLRLDRLLHDAAAPRNQLLSENMARLRLAEMSGLGLDRAFRAIARLGKEPPILEDGPRFRVVLPGGAGDEAFARFINGPDFPSRLTGDLDVLMVLTALRHSRSVRAQGLSSRLQRNPGDIERILNRMREANLVEPTRATQRRQHAHYVLTPTAIAGMRDAVSYRRRSLESDDQKLIRHLQRHGRISNEDVRAYLDCDMATARNRLTALRKRGLIDFAPGSPRRGPQVAYVKTAEFESILHDDRPS